MKVHQLIKELSEMDPMLDVIVESDSPVAPTPDGMMSFVDITDVNYIETDDGNKYCLLEQRMFDINQN